MKAYIVKIELKESKPIIWRRVIFPASVTFKRLHDIIQNVTNFQGGYPGEFYHLYDFLIEKEPLIVTNDEEAYLQHKHYISHKKMYEDRIKKSSPEMLEFEKNYLSNLKMPTYKPSGLKIDKYLEKYKAIQYVYDFGDYWQFTITLEDIVYDYYFGFPTLLDGENCAPPEDVGGIVGFYEFLEAYNDVNNPDHDDLKTWGNSIGFKDYDPKFINRILRMIQYHKTQWDKVDHRHYRIVKDRYRKE
ncbi:MAG: plasmid pRiA4b ORF-3 family protein [Caldisericia bacterium]|nr:plasmid pRiA4b ORF-3 family protein [Caldisericia bacterium]